MLQIEQNSRDYRKIAGNGDTTHFTKHCFFEFSLHATFHIAFFPGGFLLRGGTTLSLFLLERIAVEMCEFTRKLV